MLWLTRPQSLSGYVPIATAAWLIAQSGLTRAKASGLALLVVFLAAYQALLFVINDLIDFKKDKASASHMPMPSGIVSRWCACALASLLGGVFFGSMIAAASDLTGLVIALSTIPPAI